MTPHNSAKKEDIAQTVIMPGDPLRAKWIAGQFMEGARLVNDVRGILAYTGTYKGMPVTVMAHGMGIPSVGIYTWELYKFYDVKAIIRIGSAGGYTADVKVGDILISGDVVSYSRYAEDIGVDAPNGILAASEGMVELAVKTARELSIPAQVCRVFCSETFYNKYSLEECIQRSRGAKAVEMEGFALYANAAAHRRKALMLLTCSDSFVSGESMSAEERQTKFAGMVKLGFETGLALR